MQKRMPWMLLIVMLLFVGGCDMYEVFGMNEEPSEDQEPEPEEEQPVLGSSAFIESWTFRIEDNPVLDSTISGNVDEDSQIVQVRLPQAIVDNATELVAEVELSPGAAISPDPATPRGYGSRKIVEVTSEDGNSVNQFLIEPVVASGFTGSWIEDFRFEKSANPILEGDIVGSVGSAKVVVLIPYNVWSSSESLMLVPTITTGGEETTNTPTGEQNFKSAVEYSLTTTEGITRRYSVEAQIDPDSY